MNTTNTADLKIFAPAPTPSASSRAPATVPNFQFQRPDWTLFRNPATLAQKAGVPVSSLRQLVLKELADNALDAGGTVTCGRTGSGYFVQDDGPGIDGTPDDIARLFSINRPLVSSKLWRLPTRGALGNGLRVVVGAVAASQGRLQIWTRGQHLSLAPMDDGTTAVVAEPADWEVGTRIEIALGPEIPASHYQNELNWAKTAILMADGGEHYKGRTSAHWYSREVFFEMMQAAGERSVRDFIAHLDGATGAAAGRIAANFLGRTCRSLTRAESTTLFVAAKKLSKPVAPRRLGFVGTNASLGRFTGYSKQEGFVIQNAGGDQVQIPTVIEAWAVADPDDGTDVEVMVNRTPITTGSFGYMNGRNLNIMQCGLYICADIGKSEFKAVVNIITPYMPITSDGKSPDLSSFNTMVYDALLKAGRAAYRARTTTEPADTTTTRKSHKDIVLTNLIAGVAQASGDGKYRFNQRQLFYVIRPFVQKETGKPLDWGNFCQIITNYEAENGEIAGMYRDPRGTLYHQHTGEDIPLGTIAVEQYRRPSWTFNKVLYIEKEGFFEILKSVKWPERNDCALLTSKGYATRAVRDLLDLLADDDEPLTVFCVHDSDASGTMIYQCLMEETKARGRRKVEIVNLGLEPWEAIDLGLEVEDIEEPNGRRPVAEYVKEQPRPGTSETWAAFLQRHRVELNAMTTPQFLKWLDGKMVGESGKVIPPVPALMDRLRADAANKVRSAITDRVLAAANIDAKVCSALATTSWPGGAELAAAVGRWLDRHRADPWGEPVTAIAAGIANDAARAA